MKQSLSLRFGQQMKMTPQLQQAIRLMQLSSMELNLEIREALETNPMLELAEDDDLGDVATEDLGSDPEWERREESPPDGESEDEGFIEDLGIPDELPVDTSWDDVYQASTPMSPPALPEGVDFDNPASESLADHLLWQLNLSPMPPQDKLVAAAIIEAIDADGMLQLDLQDIAESVVGAFGGHGVSAEDVEAVLARVQQFEPAGVGARNLRECLLLQLHQLSPDTPSHDDAVSLVERHFDTLARSDLNALARASGLDVDALQRAIELIRSLNPRPGAAVGDFDCEYIEPDVFVRKDFNGDRGRWLVELNTESLPALRINEVYAGLVRRGDGSADNAFLRNNLQDARWFLKSLRNRNETLLKVATQIVERQRGFLDHGEEAMKPLVLADIANAVGMHESTISRVTTRKYMRTPRGVFELKYFFSSHVGTATGGEVSSTAIRALIKRYVGEENPNRPLSDSRIASMLRERNIAVARRTVAKYRESMAIPSSNDRRRLV
ncbi:MAG: RNA polymerase factor sigma-54 [Gammaproteobacteria bacterium]|nr:RNA polymerase factor sigma-54 [Gammaproteobacteria bacterium]